MSRTLMNLEAIFDNQPQKKGNGADGGASLCLLMSCHHVSMAAHDEDQCLATALDGAQRGQRYH